MGNDVTEEKKKAAGRKLSARALQVRDKAKGTATAEGKDWSKMEKEDRQAYKKTARETLKAEGTLLKRDIGARKKG